MQNQIQPINNSPLVIVVPIDNNNNQPIVVAPKKKISFKISSNALLTFEKPAIFGGGQGKLIVSDPLSFSLKEGCRIRFAQNNFICVAAKKDNMEMFIKILVIDDKAKEVVIPVNHKITSEDGNTFSNGKEIKVQLPKECPVIVLSGTLLQQVDSPAFFKLDGDCEGILIL